MTTGFVWRLIGAELVVFNDVSWTLHFYPFSKLNDDPDFPLPSHSVKLCAAEKVLDFSAERITILKPVGALLLPLHFRINSACSLLLLIDIHRHVRVNHFKLLSGNVSEVRLRRQCLRSYMAKS